MGKTTSTRVIDQRARHHAALLSMLPIEKREKTTGLSMWLKLRRIEGEAEAIGLRLCNGPEMAEGDQERAVADVTRRVGLVFGGKLPKGFFVNLDPRGYALKLEAGSGPEALHRDFGGYQILAPQID